MKPGRVIEGEVHDARQLARQLVADAKHEADAVLTGARAEAGKLTSDAEQLVQRVVDDARRYAEDLRGEALREAGQVRREARQAATQLINEARDALQAERASAVPAAPQEVFDVSARGIPAVDPRAGSLGRVTEVVGLVMRAELPGAELGEVVQIERTGGRPLPAEVVGFRGAEAVLMPLGELAGVAADSRVVAQGEPLCIECSDDLLGRVLDGLGQPLDGKPAVRGERWAVDRAAPSAFERPQHAAPLVTGVRAIDGLLTLGRGQRVGIFAAAGVGKSTLLGQIARGASADVVVVCQVGERGRELGPLRELLAARESRVVAVCATSDAPPLVRVRAVHVATAIAEWFRERRGASVLLLVDSLTRLARAQREVGLSAGEPVARHGYPPSVFALMPRLIERAGATAAGQITALYTVLVAGNDFDEPIADEVRGLVDGHLTLDRQLAQRAQFPPIDVVSSASRLMSSLVDPPHQQAADRVRRHLATYDEHRDMVTLGAYKAGSNPALDEAIALARRAHGFLSQPAHELADWDDTIARLRELAGASEPRRG
ncbi:MAG: FliI/YscN family ATPase [Myxococcales bacterium]|nr:FliI/YscN family ATPase [Myxococcales bacterium]